MSRTERLVTSTHVLLQQRIVEPGRVEKMAAGHARDGAVTWSSVPAFFDSSPFRPTIGIRTCGVADDAWRSRDVSLTPGNTGDLGELHEVFESWVVGNLGRGVLLALKFWGRDQGWPRLDLVRAVVFRFQFHALDGPFDGFVGSLGRVDRFRLGAVLQPVFGDIDAAAPSRGFRGPGITWDSGSSTTG